MRELCVLLLCLSWPPVWGVASGGCGGELPPLPRPGHHERRTLLVSDPHQGQVTREFFLHLPAQYDESNSVAVPLVLDYHWWGGSASSQVSSYPWPDIADQDSSGFIYVALQGMADVAGQGWQGSWNVSRTDGPRGLTCDPDNFQHSGTCYTSCGDCHYLDSSCDWTSCHDDVAFTETLLYQVLDTYCVDLSHVHMSGISNGGMFVYTRALHSLSARLAAVGGVAASPLRGFDFMPASPVSVLDIHGLDDTVIPYDTDQPGNLGPGPDNTVINTDGYYYTVKMSYLTHLLAAMDCGPDSSHYPTHVDGQDGWNCVRWGDCRGGAEVVHCSGHWGHQYPFQAQAPAFQIMWDFFKTHPNNGI